MALYCDVIVPLSLPGTFTYGVPGALSGAVVPGMRVMVSFGKKKIMTAVVRSLHEDIPSFLPVKEIISVVDDHPLVNEFQMGLWEWMSAYYLCDLGSVMDAALPAPLKQESISQVSLHPAFEPAAAKPTANEEMVIQALWKRETLSAPDIAGLCHLKNATPLIKAMQQKGMIVVSEQTTDRYSAKKESYIILPEGKKPEDDLSAVMDALAKRSPGQSKILETFIHYCFQRGTHQIRKSELMELSGATSSSLKGLISKGILTSKTVVISRMQSYEASLDPGKIIFSEKQAQAWTEIKNIQKEKDVLLLQGVTSSGKTEIYIRLIHEVFQQGRQVLYLLPEIALTSQIINRLRKYFGDKVQVYHSRYNEQERAEVWLNLVADGQRGLQDKRSPLILGARSALFLPYSDLGLIIVDEEHDQSYKQQDPSPRYQARDAAIVLGQLHKAKVILGSATPSLESFYNAETGKFGLVQLMERYGGVSLPEVLLVDIGREMRRKRMKSHFSQTLLDQIGICLSTGKQCILFQNRRGFSLMFSCEDCHWTSSCQHCDVTLTYHKGENRLRCHYCGFSIKPPSVCPDCQSTHLKLAGFGTEKIEEEIPLFFPQARIRRMDHDATHSRQSHQRIIQELESGKIDILIGTQMVTKGLDFDHVSLVGILNADNMMSFPDFRAFERAYQLMAQVSGRAGRKEQRGKVVIQTYHPGHPIIQQVIANDYSSMYEAEMRDRRNYKYPPIYRLIRIVLKHRELKQLDEAAMELGSILRQGEGQIVLGPEFPLISRISQYHIKQFLIKTVRGNSTVEIKKRVGEAISRFEKSGRYPGLRIATDVDPY